MQSVAPRPQSFSRQVVAVFIGLGIGILAQGWIDSVRLTDRLDLIEYRVSRIENTLTKIVQTSITEGGINGSGHGGR